MASLGLTALSLQNIRPTVDFLAFQDMCTCFAAMRKYALAAKDKNKIKGSTLNDVSGIETIVAKHIGIKVDFKAGMEMGYNAYVIPSDLDANNVLYAGRYPHLWRTSKDAISALKDTKDGVLKGSVNMVTGKVTGVFSEVSNEVFLSTQLIVDEKFTVEEITAIFAHELGHIWTQFLYMGRSVLASHVMTQIEAGYKLAESTEERVEMIKLAANRLGVEALEPSAIAKYDDVSVTQTVILGEFQRDVCSATNTSWYDNNTWEALADQFVSRIGASVHLAKGVDKIMRMYGHPTYRTAGAHIAIESILFTLVSVGTFGTLPIILAIAGLCGAQTTELYDNPKMRLERIGFDVVHQLKDRRLPAEIRNRLLKEKIAIDKLVAEMKDNSSVFDALFNFFAHQQRKSMTRAAVIQQLERLANNDLFVASQKLNNLK
jgi:hypothetical protein